MTATVVHVVGVIVIPDSTDPTLYYKCTFDDGTAESANVVILYLEMVVDKILSLHCIHQ